MRIPLTKYGWPEIVILPAIILATMVVSLILGVLFWPNWLIYIIEAVLAIVFVWLLSFFRDPYRLCPLDTRNILAPADGKITDIEYIDEEEYIGGPAIKIGIFLSIFNTHINRAPCNVKVGKITYKKGQHKNAANPETSRINESNDLNLTRTDPPNDKLIVRQISGAVARRIVCSTAEGQHLKAGDKFGMIKFGSRTELYLPARDNTKCLVKTGDKVKAGLSPLVRYEKCQD